MFELFDPNAEVRNQQPGTFRTGSKPGVTYFITFRTDDSIPKEVADFWYQLRDDWLRRHKIDPTLPDWTKWLRALPLAQQNEFHATFSRQYLECLDKGYGECVLKRSELAQIVADNLRHFDQQRYHLGDFVVMPNHVHLLVCLLGTTELEAQCYSWKKYTAGKINKALGRKGRFWQEESFDHLVRSAEQFEYLRGYIADNPKKAGLRPGEFEYWQRDDTPK